MVATAKLESNLKSSFDNYRYSEDLSHQEASTEIDINQKNFELTKKFLFERIKVDGSMTYSNALNSCAFYCRGKTGHGSQQAIRNYLDMLTSDVGPFMIARDDNNKKIIVLREGN